MDVEPGVPSHFLLVGVASAIVLALSVGVIVYRSSSTISTKAASPIGAKKGVVEEVVDPNKPRVRLLYGTQTGTAERFCKQLAGELRKKYGDTTSVDVLDLENYSPELQLPREKLVVLCVATYGDGEPTDNAAQFFSWLAKESEVVDAGEKSPVLEGVSYAVFGLGNKQYEHFNAMGKKAFKQLGTLGGRPVIRRGDGDDDACIDEDFDKWSAELVEALNSRSDLVGTALLPTDSISLLPDMPVGYDVEVVQSVKEDLPFPQNGTGKDHHSPYWATITAARELHGPTSGRSCVHVEIDISGAPAGGLTYGTGDHVAIHAANSEKVVEEVAGLLGLDLHQVVRLSVPKETKDKNLAAPPAGNLSVRTLLGWHCDLLSPPRRNTLSALAVYAQNPEHALQLSKLATTEGKQEYNEWIARPQRSLLEVLRTYPSCRPPLGVALAAFERLQPRFYSISSSNLMHQTSVHVTCAVVKEAVPTGRVHEGVASTWLQKQLGASVGGKVPVFLRSSHFKLPSDVTKPVIMVGPGTGLAPFRGFLQERAVLRAKPAAIAAANGALHNGNGVHAPGVLGPAVLFFGCRSRAADYIYEEELAAHLKGGELTALHVAFSRDGVEKDYVQHHIERNASEVMRLLDQEGGSLYVCGDAKHMAKDVHRVLLALVQQAKGCSGTQAEAWVKQLQDSGRYQRDVW